MGRKPKTLTDEETVQVEALAAYLSQEQMADYFGIARATFAAMLERDAEIARRYKRGKAKAIGLVAQGLLQKARNGDTTSAIFYLKTQAGWRETIRVGGEPDSPAALNVRVEDSLSELIARIASDGNRLTMPRPSTAPESAGPDPRYLLAGVDVPLDGATPFPDQG
jgi:hypothetical protein